MTRKSCLAALAALCLLLSSCGTTPKWQFTLETWYDTDDYLAWDSGKLLAWYEIELPHLALHSDSAAPGAEPPTELTAARDAFNGELENFRARLLREYDDRRSDAVGGYIDSGEREWNAPALVSLSVTRTRQTERLVSALAEGWEDYSGAHPWHNVHAWNFDLTEGRFLRWYDLTDDPDALRAAIAASVTAQARESAARFYDGWEDAAASMDGCAVYFAEEGLVVAFSEGQLGGHAALTPTFTVPSDTVERYFNAYGKQIVK